MSLCYLFQERKHTIDPTSPFPPQYVNQGQKINTLPLSTDVSAEELNLTRLLILGIL